MLDFGLTLCTLLLLSMSRVFSEATLGSCCLMEMWVCCLVTAGGAGTPVSPLSDLSAFSLPLHVSN